MLVDIINDMLDMSDKGYFCGQIILKLALGDDAPPDLIRALGGLSGGMGFSGHNCGALTGGCCLLGYFASKGEDDELPSAYLNEMITVLVDWFKAETAEWGGIDCADILQGNAANQITRCPALVQGALEKAVELADEFGVL